MEALARGRGWREGFTGMFDQVLIYLRFEAPGSHPEEMRECIYCMGQESHANIGSSIHLRYESGQHSCVARDTTDGFVRVGCWVLGQAQTALSAASTRHGIPAAFLIS